MAGLGPTGFDLKTLETIQSELQQVFLSIDSEFPVTNPNTVVGQFIGNFSAKFSNLWEALQASYMNTDPDTATGQSLDRICNLVGITRLAPASSFVNCLCIGTENTTLSIGRQISKDITGEVFQNSSAITIEKASATRMTISVDTVADTTLYTVIINGVDSDFTSDASATAEEIIAGLKAAVDANALPVDFTDNLDGTGVILADDAVSTFTFDLTANLAIDETATNGVFTAVETGATSAAVSTVNTIDTPVSGWDSVTNLVSATLGRDIETDAELRLRRSNSVGALGKATDEAIKNAILQDVANVTSALVFSNRTDITDGDGRPPHSFEAVVSGGLDSDVAETIWLNMPSGIQTHGNTAEVVVDSSGNDQDINFSRPTNVYIWLEIDITLYAEEDFPTTGVTLIKESIVDWSLDEYSSGVDVIYQRIGTPIYEVPGIGPIAITTGKSASPVVPPGAFTAADIVISSSEIAVFDVSRIEVSIV